VTDLHLRIESVASGGHCVARHEGRVVFVRHTLPGEYVVARVTSTGGGGKYLRADAVKILEPSPNRVAAPCAAARPSGCGGCDWQHADLDWQRQSKGDLVREALSRVGVDPTLVGAAEAVPGDEDGLHWRTRVRWSIDDSGRRGLLRHRSHDVIPLETCPLATEAVNTAELGRIRPALKTLLVAVSSGGDEAVVPEGARAPRMREVVEGREFRVRADGFWQVHPGAPTVLTRAVRAAAEVQPGEVVLDLYAGVGLFTAGLAEDCGVTGRVEAVEFDVDACADARRNLHDIPWARIHQARLEDWRIPSADVIVLDPPRSGAGRRVVAGLLSAHPRRIVYVSCDPATLARDIGWLIEGGMSVSSVRVLDLFPMTHHVEVVAVLDQR
jgi:tRNA/tmRNA/rRNA uracil-C5-methylase (TrmA/RlmC/RlmD family)